MVKNIINVKRRPGKNGYDSMKNVIFKKKVIINDVMEGNDKQCDNDTYIDD